jgi:hypothetical protein
VDARPLRLLLIFGLVLGLTALLVAPKLTTLPPLWARAERLVPQGIYGIADDYDLLRALSVLLGLEERPSGHEGQNVFHSSVPIVLAVLGMPLAFRRRPVFTVTGLFFLVLGWSGATPVNLAQVLHRLPPFDLLRVIERYALVWTLFVGFFAAFGAEALWRMPLREGLVSSRLLHLLRWISRSLMVLALMHYGIVVSPKIASVYQLGLGHPHAIPEAGAFRQVENELTNWEATRANLGKPGCRTTAWLADPGPVRVDSDPDYHGEVYLLLGDPDRPTEILPVEARIAPNRIDFHAPAAGRLVVNQNAFAGWSRDGNPAVSHGGLLAAEVGPGPGRLAYRPPGLVLGFTLLGLGLVLLAASPLLRPLPPCPRSGAKVVPGRC